MPYPVGAQQAAGKADDKSKIKTVALNLTAAAAPDPSLKYVLYPHAHEQEPGNAVIHYMTLIANDVWFEFNDEQSKWLDLPLDKLPLDKMAERIKEFSKDEFPLLQRYSRYEQCL